MAFFSIIIPVYNVEGYLRECIESILIQDFSDFEIILVNDGSTDGSKAICIEYAQCYPERVRLIDKENGGLSDARNAGMKKATGEYLIFVDSDDYITNSSLKLFYKELTIRKEAKLVTDILITRFIQVYYDGSVKYMDENISMQEINNCSKNVIVDYIFKHSRNTWPAQRYIVNKSFVEEYDLEFKKGYLHEDVDWTMKLFLYAEQFFCVEHYWYAHRIDRSGSITSKPNVKRVLDVIDIVKDNISDQNFNSLNSNSKVIMFRRLVNSLYSSISMYHLFDEIDKKIIVENLDLNIAIFKYTSQVKHKMFYIVSKIFGVKLSIGIIRLFN
ncbi:glycosyltransferase family 2 protein [Paenibacillus sp. JSM ZJ436]|uniref:glycosyltransferase family 2 protein n=1 Tax=Paenibacillus sp. JSM ZJ436 TaxID=3376190 RepID=UPI0037921B10